MRPLDVEEALDFVEAEVKKFNSQHNTDDFVMLSCGPDPQHIGEGGGPIGVVMWGCAERDRFGACRDLIRALLDAVKKISVVVDVEVEESLDEDGEIWYIEFVKEWSGAV